MTVTRFRLPEDYKILPNLSDNFRHLLLKIQGIDIEILLVPVEMGKAHRLTLEKSNKVVFYCGDILHYGVYVEDKKLIGLVSHNLSFDFRSTQMILSDYWLKYRKSFIEKPL